MILGITALVSPLLVHSQILRKELPILLAVTALAAWQLLDGSVSRLDAFVLLGVFAALMAWTIREGMSGKADQLGTEVGEDLDAVAHMPLRRALIWLAVGLVSLIAASRLLVWGAVDIAVELGISDLVIGLTIVAIGTSLPELASSVIAARKGENDIALGNIIGSNLFNTLAVVGIAGGISSITVPPEVLGRDVATMAGLAVLLCVLGYRRNGHGSINRLEGGVLLLCFGAYTGWSSGSSARPSTKLLRSSICAGRSYSSSRRHTISVKSSRYICTADRLTATEAIASPAARQLACCAIAVRNTQLPISRIRPLSSAMGIKRAGEV